MNLFVNILVNQISLFFIRDRGGQITMYHPLGFFHNSTSIADNKSKIFISGKWRSLLKWCDYEKESSLNFDTYIINPENHIYTSKLNIFVLESHRKLKRDLKELHGDGECHTKRTIDLTKAFLRYSRSKRLRFFWDTL